MTDKQDDDYRGDGVNPKFIYNPSGVHLDGSLRVGASLFNDGRIHGAELPIAFTTQQSTLMKTGAMLGENLLGMHINTIGDARNFLVGVNNVASQFTMNESLIGAIQSVSDLSKTHGAMMASIDKITIPSAATGLYVDTSSYHLKMNEVVRLSESVTTVLAYGQAVQKQFGTILTDNGTLAVRDTSIRLNTGLNPNPVYIGTEAITSPFIYAPQKVKTKEITKVLPDVKKELPAKTTRQLN